MEELELNSFFFPPLFVERGRERESSHSILCRSLNLTCAQVRFHLHLSDQSNQLFHRLYKISDITFVFFHPSFRGPFPLWASIVQQSMKGQFRIEVNQQLVRMLSCAFTQMNAQQSDIDVIVVLTAKVIQMLRRSERAYLLCFHFLILSELCCCSA